MEDSTENAVLQFLSIQSKQKSWFPEEFIASNLSAETYPGKITEVLARLSEKGVLKMYSPPSKTHLNLYALASKAKQLGGIPAQQDDQSTPSRPIRLKRRRFTNTPFKSPVRLLNQKTPEHAKTLQSRNDSETASPLPLCAVGPNAAPPLLPLPFSSPSSAFISSLPELPALHPVVPTRKEVAQMSNIQLSNALRKAEAFLQKCILLHKISEGSGLADLTAEWREIAQQALERLVGHARQNNPDVTLGDVISSMRINPQLVGYSADEESFV